MNDIISLWFSVISIGLVHMAHVGTGGSSLRMAATTTRQRLSPRPAFLATMGNTYVGRTGALLGTTCSTYSAWCAVQYSISDGVSVVGSSMAVAVGVCSTGL